MIVVPAVEVVHVSGARGRLYESERAPGLHRIRLTLSWRGSPLEGYVVDLLGEAPERYGWRRVPSE